MSAADPIEAAPAAGSAAWWLERGARLERRKPRADGLTVERIVDAAIDLVDREGLEALTVRGLAARFETGPATLYRHVASREELLVLLVDHVLGEVDPPAPDLPARAQVEGLASGLRRVLLRHPNLVPALPASPLQGPNAVLGSERALSALLADGFPIELALAGYLALIDYVLGSVFFDSARRASEELLVLDSDRAFAFGLGTFLDGLASRVHETANTRDR